MFPVAWMNGTPYKCHFCSQPFTVTDKMVNAYQSDHTGKLYCNETCRSMEEDEDRRVVQ